MTSKIYDSYAGQYELAPDFIITVTNENGKLMVQATGQSKFEFFPESEMNFFPKHFDGQIRFVKDAQGKVTGLILRDGETEESAQKIK